MSQATIIGGGLAGLAAGAALAERSFDVTILESRPRLGGRASSFIDPVTGETIDNCQHVAMGCCTNFNAFCQLVGIEGQFRTESELHFIGPDGKRCAWKASSLPAPFHLMPAFFRLGYLTLPQKVTAARGLRSLVRHGGRPGESFAGWLKRHHQPPEVIERFWEVVLVSALSESMDRIDVGYARKVFVDGFLANREGWKVIIPNQPLDEIYGPVKNWLEKRGATVRTSAGVDRIEFEGDRAVAVHLRNDETIEADDIVVAVPWDRAEALVQGGLLRNPGSLEKPGFCNLMEAAPISSVHLWFDRPITDLPHAVFVGKSSQWLFQRGEEASTSETESAPPGRSFYYQIVVSASRGFLQMESRQAIELVRRELASVWPIVNEARLLRGRIVTEHKAVFSPLPGIDDVRPTQRTSIPNLHLAGDWTRTGWPATMEGAVKSGFLAAESVLERSGRPANLIAPPLPPARLSKLLFGC
ncbi:hydroxysqualene dehydroxylase HpnE [Caulifigura coniformis]|uniref:hydroxysqualene dehydroxylase HpnE n=1 Tax=Caulifigura coniformis TaxID=2527983 RepID=UPI0018D21E32|nr:hydroxysqualene dehydroxylase HpnE [Caulifigura coniformis]